MDGKLSYGEFVDYYNKMIDLDMKRLAKQQGSTAAYRQTHTHTLACPSWARTGDGTLGPRIWGRWRMWLAGIFITACIP